jgi:hypothetical protein
MTIECRMDMDMQDSGVLTNRFSPIFAKKVSIILFDHHADHLLKLDLRNPLRLDPFDSEANSFP